MENTEIIVPPPGCGSVGWRILVPGWTHWRRREGERAGVLFGTFVASLGVGLFAWGTRPGFMMLAVAFLVHVFSATDVIRTSAFPGFAPWVPSVTASFGLGLGCYLPTFAVASVLAWPDQPSEKTHENYLINRWAYKAQGPGPGDWVWYGMSDGRSFGLGRMVARAGQSVEWIGGRLIVDGIELGWTPTAREGQPADLAMLVPDEQLLVAPDPEPGQGLTGMGLTLISRGHVIGRPWAKIYPIWSRRLIY